MTVTTLLREPFFSHLRFKFGTLKQSQVNGINAVLDATLTSPLSWRAYKLATTWHETNATMEPVVEAYWIRNAEAWRKKNLRYWPWHGRGYVQLTWEANYRKADQASAAAKLTQPGDILKNPDLVLLPAVSGLILNAGMDEGWFTGVRCSTVLPAKGTATRKQYMNARTIINGNDKSDLVEDYAQVFEKALRNGGQE